MSGAHEMPGTHGTSAVITLCGDRAFIEEAVMALHLPPSAIACFTTGTECRRSIRDSVHAPGPADGFRVPEVDCPENEADAGKPSVADDGKSHDGPAKRRGAVFIGPELIDVTPINLAAAISKDIACTEGPDIYLFADTPISASFQSRSHAAGVADVFPVTEIGAPEVVLVVRKAMAEARMDGYPSAVAAIKEERADGGPAGESHADGEGPSKPSNVDINRRGGVSLAGDGSLDEDDFGIRDGLGRREGIILPFLSGRGGTGKTTLSLLGAMELAKEGFSVALVDLDLQFGDLAYLLGRNDSHRVDELIMLSHDPTVLATQLPAFATMIPGDVAFFASPTRPEDGDRVTPHVALILDAMKQAYDICVINTGTLWDEAHIVFIQKSDCVLMVCDQRVASLHSCANAIDLCARLGLPLARIRVLLNRFASKGAISDIDASVALKGVTTYRVSEGMREVDQLVSIGTPEELFELRNPCVTSLSTALQSVMLSLGMTQSLPEKPRKLPSLRKQFSFSLRRGDAR